ncbi:RNA polymerase sigma factor (plasmid) [Paracoccus ferrooxidans]|nr:RNA polymerase sigma factor [Paracoccus ferrooxidans]
MDGETAGITRPAVCGLRGWRDELATARPRAAWPLRHGRARGRRDAAKPSSTATPKPLWCRATMEPTFSFDKLYLGQRGRLQRLVLRVTGQRATAEDVVHDAFLRLLNMPQGHVIAQDAWLARVARNLALNHMRHERQGVVVDAPPGGVETITSDTPSAEMVLVCRESLRRVMQAILALPPRRREIFVLHRFGELTYDEIAARLGISRNTVMVQIVNALADLRRELGRDFFRQG